MGKFKKMARFTPSLYKPTQNPKVRGLLYAWSTEDDKVVEAAQNAKEQIFVKTARLQYLDSLGSNVGVFRPTEFNLSDDQYKDLIPTLSFYPKQVVTTIKKVLDVFYGAGNPNVKVFESTPNEIVIQIPSSVPALRRDLRGSQHLHAYNGEIVSIDNVTKEMEINLLESTKNLLEDELELGAFGQSHYVEPILSNTAGNTGVTLQFFASADLSVFSTSDNFNITLANYPGSFLPDTTSAFTVTSKRGVLGQNISSGSIVTTLTMQDASGIPDVAGEVIFNFGFDNQEHRVRYFGRPNNSTLLLDPSYLFTEDHSIGEVVNVLRIPYKAPRINGNDYSFYLVGVVAARQLAQQIVESIAAAGVVIRWVIKEPKCV